MVDQLRKKNIEKLIVALHQTHAGKSEAALKKLSFYFSDEDVSFVYEKLTEQKDAQGIYWLIKYLVQVERPCGFEKLLLLTQSDSALTRQEACDGISRIPNNYKTDILIRMLESGWVKEVCFAVDALGRLRKAKSLEPLLRLLEKNEDHEVIAVSVLKALGKMADKRSLPLLEYLSDEKSGDIQQEAISALSRFAQILPAKYLSRWLEFDSIKIKELMYLAMLRKTDKKTEMYIARGILNENNEGLKASILTSIRSITTKKFYDVVLRLAFYDASRKIRVLAQTVIKKAKRREHLKWLMHNRAKCPLELRADFYRLLVEFSHEKKVFNFYKRSFSKDKEKKLKLVAIECMGRLRNKRVMPFLLKLLKNNEEFYYAASISLSYQITPKHWKIVGESLSLDQKKRSLTIQVFLKFIDRLPKNYLLPDFIERIIENLINSESEHIRCLATRCLVKTTKADKLYLLLNLSRNDSSRNIRKSALSGLIEYLTDRPQDLMFLLSMGSNQPEFMPIVRYIFMNVSANESNFQQILKVLLILIKKENVKSNSDEDGYNARFMVVLRYHVLNQKSLFLYYLMASKWDDYELKVMMKVLNKTKMHELEGINVDFMAQLYESATIQTKKEFLLFFEKLFARSKTIEDIVFHSVAKEEDSQLQRQLNTTVKEWLVKSA